MPNKRPQTLRELSLVTATEPSHNAHVCGRTMFTSTTLKQVSAPDMKGRPKDLGLALQHEGFLKLCIRLCPVFATKAGFMSSVISLYVKTDCESWSLLS